jgi:IS5 family transposase
MKPSERRETGEHELFRSRLDQIIDMEHAQAKLERAIDWGFLESTSARSMRTAPAGRRCRHA